MNRQRSLEELERIIAKLTEELNFLKLYVALLEQELSAVKGPEWEALKAKVRKT